MSRKPVARVGDTGSHGGSIIDGSPIIRANNRPIALVGSIYNCPVHGPNPIVTGAPYVFGNDVLVAHVGSKTACGAEITSGSPDVFINVPEYVTPISTYADIIKRCTGNEKITLSNEFNDIPSYIGNLPSPFPYIVLREYQRIKVFGVHLDASPVSVKRIDGYVVSSRTVRQWVKEAADYHGIPYLMLAVILQQENGPSASEFRKFLQFAERIGTSVLNVWDEAFFDIVPDNLSRGSTGIPNMSRNTLKNTVTFTQKYYGRHPVPAIEQQRVVGDRQLPDLPGYDWKIDLYYAAAHLRELICRITSDICYSGELNAEQMEKVFRAYNGTGDLAKKYGKDAMNRIKKAKKGEEWLYFYEK